MPLPEAHAFLVKHNTRARLSESLPLGTSVARSRAGITERLRNQVGPVFYLGHANSCKRARALIYRTGSNPMIVVQRITNLLKHSKAHRNRSARMAINSNVSQDSGIFSRDGKRSGHS